jgi:hypothetical protein
VLHRGRRRGRKGREGKRPCTRMISFRQTNTPFIISVTTRWEDSLYVQQYHCRCKSVFLEWIKKTGDSGQRGVQLSLSLRYWKYCFIFLYYLKQYFTRIYDHIFALLLRQRSDTASMQAYERVLDRRPVLNSCRFRRPACCLPAACLLPAACCMLSAVCLLSAPVCFCLLQQAACCL